MDPGEGWRLQLQHPCWGPGAFCRLEVIPHNFCGSLRAFKSSLLKLLVGKRGLVEGLFMRSQETDKSLSTSIHQPWRLEMHSIL